MGRRYSLVVGRHFDDSTLPLLKTKGHTMKNNANVNLLAAWNDDADVAAAQFAVDPEVSAVVLADRVSKLFRPY
jgi:hypothetical protein